MKGSLERWYLSSRIFFGLILGSTLVQLKRCALGGCTPILWLFSCLFLRFFVWFLICVLALTFVCLLVRDFFACNLFVLFSWIAWKSFSLGITQMFRLSPALQGTSGETQLAAGVWWGGGGEGFDIDDARHTKQMLNIYPIPSMGLVYLPTFI